MTTENHPTQTLAEGDELKTELPRELLDNAARRFGYRSFNDPRMLEGSPAWIAVRNEARDRLNAAAAELFLELEYLVSLGGGDCLDGARAVLAKSGASQ